MRSGGGEPQGQVARKSFEVAVAVQQLDVIPHGDRGDEAVGQRSDRLTRTAAPPVRVSGLLELGESADRQETGSGEQAPQPRKVNLVAGPGETLHDDWFRGCQLLLAGDQRVQPVIRGTAGGAEVIDPG